MTTIEELKKRIEYLENLFPKCLRCGKIHKEKRFYREEEISTGLFRRKKKMMIGNTQFCSQKCLDDYNKDVEYI